MTACGWQAPAKPEPKRSILANKVRPYTQAEVDRAVSSYWRNRARVMGKMAKGSV